MWTHDVKQIMWTGSVLVLGSRHCELLTCNKKASTLGAVKESCFLRLGFDCRDSSTQYGRIQTGIPVIMVPSTIVASTMTLISVSRMSVSYSEALGQGGTAHPPQERAQANMGSHLLCGTWAASQRENIKPRNCIPHCHCTQNGLCRESCFRHKRNTVGSLRT